MRKTKIILGSILLFAIVLISCHKEVVKYSNEIEFCAFINAEEYNKTSSVIDKYLNGLNKGLSDTEKLELLKDWLKSKSCVIKAEILCNSCLETNPPQSEIRVTFLVQEQHLEKTLDIIMDKVLRFGNFHD